VNPPPGIPSIIIIHPTCTTPTGTVTVQPPLVAGDTYSINGVDFQSNPQFTGVAPNDYTLTVLSAAGCMVTIDITVNAVPAAPPQPTFTPPACTATTTTITVTSPLGAQYTYSTDGINFQSSTDFDLAPGNYTLQ